MMPVRRMFKYRIYPTKRQVEVLARSLELCAELYNAALQERRDAWRLNRVTVNFFGQCKQLKEIRRERPEFAEMNFDVAADTLKRVDRAFTAFFLRVRRGGAPGYPRFKPARRYDSITFRNAGRAIEGSRLRLSKVGWVKINLHRPLEGVIKEIHVKRSCGKWYAVFSVVCEPKPLPACDARVGIDVGLSSFATLDDGSEVENPRWYNKAHAKLRRAQRRVARRRMDSARRSKVVALLAKIHARVRDQRADFHHKLSRLLVDSYDFIAVEDLNVKGLAGSMLAKFVHDAGWASFFHKLAYKAESAGRVLVRVDPRGTSQRCVCGASVPKRLSQRRHSCGDCGLDVGRDRAAAMEILRLGLSLQAST